MEQFHPMPIAIWKYARRVIGDPETVVMSNRHCLGRDKQEYCFGVWAPGAQFVNLIHVATVATIEDHRYQNVRPAFTAMLAATSTFPVGAGMLFAFPGWLAVDRTGTIWKGL